MSAEVIRRLETYVDENRDAVEGGAWIEGQGWDQTLWEGKQFPTAVSRMFPDTVSPEALVIEATDDERMNAETTRFGHDSCF
jgi:hypothetical protein